MQLSLEATKVAAYLVLQTNEMISAIATCDKPNVWAIAAYSEVATELLRIMCSEHEKTALTWAHLPEDEQKLIDKYVVIYGNMLTFQLDELGSDDELASQLQRQLNFLTER